MAEPEDFTAEVTFYYKGFSLSSLNLAVEAGLLQSISMHQVVAPSVRFQVTEEEIAAIDKYLHDLAEKQRRDNEEALWYLRERVRRRS